MRKLTATIEEDHNRPWAITLYFGPDVECQAVLVKG